MATYAFTYQTVTPESAEHGDYDDHGFYDPNGGWKFSLNDPDTAEHVQSDRHEYEHTVLHYGELKHAIEQAQHLGICEASDSHIGTGTWFTSIDPDVDYATGEDTTYSFHVRGVTRATMKRIHRALNTHSGLNIYNKCSRLEKWIAPVRACIDNATRELGSDLCGFARFDLVMDNFNDLKSSDVRIILEVLRRANDTQA